MTTATATVLTPRGPFSLAETRAFVGHWAPASRHAPADDQPLRLTAALDGNQRPIAFALTQEGDGDVHVEIAGTDDTETALAQLARIVSLDHDARDYLDVGRRDPVVGALQAARPGLRPTLFGSPYEAAAWGVISARMTMRQASRVWRELAETHGHALEVGGATVHAFPSPETLLDLDAVPGLAAEKVRRLRGIAEAALEGRLDVDRLRALGPVGARAELRRLRGIGEFWASGIWLRACGVVDEFPDEPMARAALARRHHRGPAEPLDDLIERLRPYRMWVALLLRVAG